MEFDGSRGEMLPITEYVKTTPRRWTDSEIEWLSAKRKEGASIADLSEALGRSEVSVSVKLKRLQKSDDTYNVKFRDKKYLANHAFLELIEPKSVLDLYAGKSFWKPLVPRTLTNDIDEKCDTDYHENALDVLCRLYLERRKFDLVDLDPFGSSYECFDFAFRMARKGVIISFGEWGHLRWRRLDYVRHRYGINNLDDWSADKFIEEAQRIALLHKKKATVVDSLNYGNFLRVYFSVEQFKETSQWDGQ